MKRLTMVFAVTVLFSACTAQADTAPPIALSAPTPVTATKYSSDVSTTEQGDTSNSEFVYEDCFSIIIPESWENKFHTNEFSQSEVFRGVSFIDDENCNAGWGGELFRIIIYPKDIWDGYEGIAYATSYSIKSNYFKLGESAANVFIMATPSDVQYNLSDNDSAARYQELFNGVETIYDSFKILQP